MVAMLEIASKFTTSLLLEGVKRCYGGLSFAWDRKQKIGRALNATPEKRGASVVAEKSIRDLELVIGNSFGAFTDMLLVLLGKLKKVRSQRPLSGGFCRTTMFRLCIPLLRQYIKPFN